MTKNVTKKEREEMKKIGDRIVRIATEKGTTVTEISRNIDVSQSGMFKIAWGKGNPCIISLMRIADYLGVKVSDFLEDE